MNGLFCINKPIGMTSFDVVAILRKKLNMKKIGHTGTLDPNACGLMIILLGNSTKLLPYIVHQSKHYRASVKCGIKTDTADIWGNVIEHSEIREISQSELNDVFKTFIGKQKQIPPMVSAISINGKRLYEYAREGKVIERDARDIEIFALDGKVIKDGFEFDVHASSGTYVRVLCEDISEKLGMCGTLSSLDRFQIEHLTKSDAIDLDKVDAQNIHFIDPLKLIDYPKVEIEDPTIFYHGKRFEYDYLGERLCIVYQSKLLAIYEYDEELKNYKSLRGLW